MTARQCQLILGVTAIVSEVVGVVSFLGSLSHVDWIMGHSQVPPVHIFWALGAAVLGLIATVAWFALARSDASGTLRRPKSAEGIALGVLAIPALLVTLLATPLLPGALETHQTAELRDLARRGSNPDYRPPSSSQVRKLIRVLKTDNDQYHLSLAANALGDMGPAAEDAVPALIGALGRMTPTNHSACKALTEIGSAAVPALDDAIRENPDPRVRTSSVMLLRRMAPDAITAAPTFRQALHDEHPTVRLAAAEALREIPGQPDEALVTVLLQLMDGAEDPTLRNGSTLRRGAIGCLGRIGPAAKTAAPALRRALDDDRPHIRMEAACSLWSIEQNAEDALPVFVELLESADRDVAATAAYRVGHLGPAAAPVVPELVRAFREGQPAMRERVLRSLHAIGPAAKAAVPALVEVVVSVEAKPTDESHDALFALMVIDPGTVAKIIEDHPNVAKILRPQDRRRLLELARTEGED